VQWSTLKKRWLKQTKDESPNKKLSFLKKKDDDLVTRDGCPIIEYSH
jgi:hypothetical protein